MTRIIPGLFLLRNRLLQTDNSLILFANIDGDWL